VIGRDLLRRSSLALGLSLLFTLLYISVRFKFSFGLATILGMVHDILVVLGVLALFRVPLNAPFVGAFLAIVTYSVQDGVVVMDRIREKLRYRGPKEPFDKLANAAVTETWVRSFNTSFTTFSCRPGPVYHGGFTDPRLLDDTAGRSHLRYVLVHLYLYAAPRSLGTGQRKSGSSAESVVCSDFRTAQDNAGGSMNLRDFIRDIPDFPQKGIIFRDLTPLMGNAEAFGFASRSVARKHVVALTEAGFIEVNPKFIANR